MNQRMKVRAKKILGDLFQPPPQSRVERVLEFGPLDRPLVTPDDVATVRYVDHDSQEQLRARFDGDPNVDTASIPFIDYVVRGRIALPELIHETFDCVVASHVFEHLPNPIAWLRDVHALLEPGGVVALAIPDRRFTFDLIRPPTSVGTAIEAFLTDRHRPTFADVFDQNFYWRNVDAGAVWSGTVSPWTESAPLPLETAFRYARRVLETDEYLDVHCNLLTATEFSVWIRAFRELGFVDFSIDRLVECPHNDNEFLVHLRRV